MDERRGNKLMKLKLMETPWIILFTPDEIETLLSSTKLIDKSHEYAYIHRWLGINLLTR